MAIGLPMLVFGAWPVLKLMGLDILLLWLRFERSGLDARRRGTLVLADGDPIVEGMAPDGERGQVGLDACRLRVDRDARAERLVVTSHGNQVVIGRFLAPAGRLEVAEQLKAAIAAMRAPRYMGVAVAG